MSMTELRAKLVAKRNELSTAKADLVQKRTDKKTQEDRLVTLKGELQALVIAKRQALDETAIETICQQISGKEQEQKQCETLISNLQNHTQNILPRKIGALEEDIRSILAAMLETHYQDILEHFQSMSPSDVKLMKDFVVVTARIQSRGYKFHGYGLGGVFTAINGELTGQAFTEHETQMMDEIENGA
ncbi:hypothetical protein OPW41_08870 [Vibrio europaeus]|uniref:hypothetical protein n=1 Tax=Vibrio europaeus TaxID=300876 RepID=UPI00233F43DB|nr:hypothetical protein [Vibrio europaeus]MDC5755219.1 hypothetical protein [Vibrio europaeus]MDC5775798.1 hypothetical protein [Vibrio europaeus]MDC5794936.1 hypothetical protein [Vibrio europaeus]MDC5799507.1 hypothetical protein [Vibrio europaeus]MDC5817215.1 hypothetical protein [Vibrio europaeus]